MALPKIPVPKYEVVVPSGKKILVRPYLAKESMLLLLAQQSGERSEIVSAIKQVVNNCILDDRIDVETLPSFDVEYLFLRIRAFSVGQEITLQYTCNKELDGEKRCQGVFEHTVNINKITIDKKIKKEDNIIKLVDDFSMIMRYPNFNILEKNINLIEKIEETENNKNMFSPILDVMYDCTESIIKGDDIYNDFTRQEFHDFIENMTDEVFEKITKFFSNIPKLYYEMDFLCPKCGLKEKIIIDSLSDFFD